jgi:hypothetical protein
MSTAFIQSRSEDGGLNFYPSIKMAMEAAETDLTIWKISWTDAITKERIRLVRQGDNWIYEPIFFKVEGLVV